MRKRIVTLRRRQRTPVGRVGKAAAWVLSIVFVMVILGLVIRSVQRRSALASWRAKLEEGQTTAIWPTWRSDWPTLPKRPAHSRVLLGDFEGPYAFAALNAELLGFIPCYCGCRREGHRSVLKCFVKDFTPGGMPVWTDHAFTCQTCVSIVRETALMARSGLSLGDIRRAIDEHHGGMGSVSTETPLPK